MHEMGIAMRVLNIALESLPKDAPDFRVKRVKLRVGKLAAVVPASLRFCFDVITKETPLAGSELAIEEVPVFLQCSECGWAEVVFQPSFRCKDCGSGAVNILSGRELEVVSLEIED